MAWHVRTLALGSDRETPPACPRPRRGRGRPPIHLSAALNLLLPSQVFPQFPGSRLGGEKRLMLAVLQDAIAILLKHRNAADPRAQRLYFETAEWIRSEDAEWPFSFVNVCDAVGFSRSSVRRAIARLLPAPR